MPGAGSATSAGMTELFCNSDSYAGSCHRGEVRESRRSSRDYATTGSTRTAANFNSGCFERGSTASLAEALETPLLVQRDPQWNGANTDPARIASVTLAGASKLPRLEVTRTGWRSRTPSPVASAGLISRNGSRSDFINLAERPVRVIVCH